MARYRLRTVLYLLVGVAGLLRPAIAQVPHSERQQKEHSPNAQQTTQRVINEIAASVDQVRATILDAGDRKRGEAVSTYLRRITNRHPGESEASFQARMASYLNLIDAAVHALDGVHNVPTLQDNSAANTTQWAMIVRTASALPGRNTRLKKAWSQIQSGHAVTIDSRSSIAFTAFQTEFVGVFQSMLAISTALHDARP